MKKIGIKKKKGKKLKKKKKKEKKRGKKWGKWGLLSRGLCYIRCSCHIIFRSIDEFARNFAIRATGQSPVGTRARANFLAL